MVKKIKILLAIHVVLFTFSCNTSNISKNNDANSNSAESKEDSINGIENILTPNTPSIPIVFLGSYHMSNPNADTFNLESDDVLVLKRQKEIQEVVELLARFKPTKIAVEAPRGDSTTIARYKSYLKGDLELRKSEEEQIGFRLAKFLGHETIYPIDVKMKLNYSEVMALVQADPQNYGAYMSKLEVVGETAMTTLGNWLKNGTIREMLYKMNDPKIEDIGHQLYFHSFMPIVKETNYAGADLVSNWYQRNLRIFSNLHQIAINENDRILVVYGQGHVPLLKQFTKDSPYFKIEDVRKYLKKE